MPARPPIRVLIADDDPRIREVLADLINDDASLVLVGVATDGEEAVSMCAAAAPDVVVMDVRMPNGGGVQAVRTLVSRGSVPAILAFSAYTDGASIRAMVHAGAAGYVPKGADSDDIVKAIRSVASGESFLSGEIATEVIADYRHTLVRESTGAAARTAKIAEIKGILKGGDGLAMVYQPVVDMQGTTVGFEALSRFSPTPHRAPDAWFAEAHELGLGDDLELFAIAAALRDLAVVPSPCYLAVNAGPSVLMSGRLDELLKGVAGSRVVIEITEHAPISDYRPLVEVMASWRAQGVRIAIDDAGAGYASLHHILEIEPDIIKLDLSLVRRVDCMPKTRALARALTLFGTEIGATMLGEGVETASELQALEELGVTCAQGYLIGRPMPPAIAFGPTSSWVKG